MSRYCLLALILIGLSGSAADAMPVERLGAAVALTPVSSGCGLGVRRGPYDGCYPVYGYIAGYYRGHRNPYYAGPVTRGVCGGRGTHLACNYFGICWVACN